MLLYNLFSVSSMAAISKGMQAVKLAPTKSSSSYLEVPANAG